MGSCTDVPLAFSAGEESEVRRRGGCETHAGSRSMRAAFARECTREALGGMVAIAPPALALADLTAELLVPIDD